MMKKPVISIIISAYNKGNDIARCLDAIVGQTFHDIEVICVDDGSDDGTLDIIQEYTKNDPRITVISKEHSGVADSRNKGLQSASGTYIMFCDADDYYAPTMCEKMLACMVANNNVDLVISEINVIYNAHIEMKLSDDNYYSLKFDGVTGVNEEVIINTDLSLANKLFRKSIIDQNNIAFPEGLLYEDAYFCSAYLFASKIAFYLNERLYNYVRHEQSIMSDTWSTQADTDHAIDHVLIAIQLYNFLNARNLLDRHGDTFWYLFADYLQLAVHYSKTRAKRNQARNQAKEFIAEHKEYFNDANSGIKNRINSLISKKFAPTSDRIKRGLLKFMPIYRLQVENVINLRTLKAKNQQIIDEINAK